MILSTEIFSKRRKICATLNRTQLVCWCRSGLIYTHNRALWEQSDSLSRQTTQRMTEMTLHFFGVSSIEPTITWWPAADCTCSPLSCFQDCGEPQISISFCSTKITLLLKFRDTYTNLQNYGFDYQVKIGMTVTQYKKEYMVWASGLGLCVGVFISWLGWYRSTSSTRRVCAIPRPLARGHDKSCDPLHGTKIRLILKGGNASRIRD